jgi:4-amino-4-deoxy-L-arabinose transferase-like glycosyltransferase
MRPAARAALFGGALAVSLAMAFLVFRGGTSHWLAAVWFLSLFPFALATRRRRPIERETASLPARALLLLAVAALPVLVRVANFDSDRMHTDEFISSYFSATHDFAHSSFFSPIPKWYEWEAQFPSPYFFLQRVFFTLFGESILTLRLSVQIYVALVSVMLFLIVREIFDQKAAWIAVVLYSFFAVSVWLETLGLHFISSTAVFTAFFYFALREYRTGEMFYAALAGIACGLCYLTYYSSYLAFPMLLAFCALHWLRKRSWLVLQNFAITLAGMLLVLAPFVAFGLRSGNYVWHRTNQVSLLTGEWSRYREQIANGTRSPLSVIGENLALSLKSFVQDDIGGHGGYDFGHRAFFDRFTLVLFLAGALAGLVLLFRKTELFFVFLAIGASFMTGMVLTIPPPAYHRFSIAFPFLVILMTLPLSLLLRIRPLPMSVRYALAGGLLLLFACVNQRRFVEAVCLDAPADELRLARFLNQRYPGRSLYLAAYGGFGFEKVLYFAMKNRPPKIQTDYHENLLKVFNCDEKYVYVILFPNDFNEKFRQADPKGRLFQFSGRLSVFAN